MAEKLAFSKHKDSVISAVKAVGDVGNLENWRSAFPDVEFEDIDEGLTGKPIEWPTYTPTEKAAYVLYMRNTQAAGLKYTLDADGYNVRHEIDDSERFWYAWFDHSLRFFDGEDKIPVEARKTLLYYAAQGETEDIVMDAIYDPRAVKVERMEFWFEPAPKKTKRRKK